VYQTIQAFRRLFINYFNDFGRTWQVYVEAEALTGEYGESGAIYVRNSAARGSSFCANEF